MFGNNDTNHHVIFVSAWALNSSSLNFSHAHMHAAVCCILKISK